MRSILAALVIVNAVHCQAQEPIPREFQQYFERADKARAVIAGQLTKEMQELDNAIQSESSAKLKEPLRKKRSEVAAAIKDLNRTKPFAFLPPSPAIDDIGVLPRSQMTVIDGERAIAQPDGRYFVLTRTDTKKFKHEMQLEEVWRIIPASASVERAVKSKLTPNIKYHVLEPVSKAEMDKYRKQYDARSSSTLSLASKHPATGAFPVDHLALEQRLIPLNLKFTDKKDPQDEKATWRVAEADKGHVMLRIEGEKLTRVVLLYTIDKANDKSDGNIFATINRSLLEAGDLPRAAFWFGAVSKMRSEENKYATKLEMQDFPNTVMATEFGKVRITNRSVVEFDIASMQYDPAPE